MLSSSKWLVVATATAHVTAIACYTLGMSANPTPKTEDPTDSQIFIATLMAFCVGIDDTFDLEPEQHE